MSITTIKQRFCLFVKILVITCLVINTNFLNAQMCTPGTEFKILSNGDPILEISPDGMDVFTCGGINICDAIAGLPSPTPTPEPSPDPSPSTSSFGIPRGIWIDTTYRMEAVPTEEGLFINNRHTTQLTTLEAGEFTDETNAGRVGGKAIVQIKDLSSSLVSDLDNITVVFSYERGQFFHHYVNLLVDIDNDQDIDCILVANYPTPNPTPNPGYTLTWSAGVTDTNTWRAVPLGGADCGIPNNFAPNGGALASLTNYATAEVINGDPADNGMPHLTTLGGFIVAFGDSLERRQMSYFLKSIEINFVNDESYYYSFNQM